MTQYYVWYIFNTNPLDPHARMLMAVLRQNDYKLKYSNCGGGDNSVAVCLRPSRPELKLIFSQLNESHVGWRDITGNRS